MECMVCIIATCTRFVWSIIIPCSVRRWWWCGILVTFLCAMVHVHYVLVRFPALFLCISTSERVREEGALN